MGAADPFEGMTDEQVFAKALKAFNKASQLTPGSLQRSIQWGLFDSAMAELQRRLNVYIQTAQRKGNDHE